MTAIVSETAVGRVPRASSAVVGRVPRARRSLANGPGLLLFALALSVPLKAAESALTLHATAAGADVPLTIELFRWSTDAERAPLLAALAPPAPAPQPPAAAEGRGRGAGGRGAAATPAAAGRAGRGGRGGAAPADPLARLTTAVKAAPTLGFIWGSGVTGYSIKYAWHTPGDGGRDRIVLVTERRLGAHAPDWTPAPAVNADAEFTLVEMRVDAKGVGEAKASLTTNVALDAAAKTIALDGYEAAPVLLKVSR